MEPPVVATYSESQIGPTVATSTLIASFATLPLIFAAFYMLLRRYQGAFVESKLFLALTFGLFLGVLVAFFETIAFPFDSADFRQAIGPGNAFLFFVLGYAFFESGILVMFSNLRSFRARRDTPYYSAALGLAMGATASLQAVAVNSSRAESAGLSYTVGTYLVLIVLPIGWAFALGGAGAFIGKYSGGRDTWKGWGYGSLMLLPLTFLRFLYLPSAASASYAGALTAVVGFLTGAYLLRHGRNRVLDKVLPPEIKKQAQLAERRGRRQR